MSTKNKLESIENEQFRNRLNDNLDKINASLINQNKILSVFLVLAMSENNLKTKTLNEIKTVIPNYTELLKTISENIKWLLY